MTFREYSSGKIVVYDGAMGTQIQKIDIAESVWNGRVGCNEYLSIVAPDIISSIHDDYFKSGADVAVTNTFGAIKLVLDEYDLGDKVIEINRAAVKLARDAANKYDNKFVSLSIGPGTKLISLNQITYDTLYAQYTEQVECVIDDIDLVNIETSQDVLQMRVAINVCKDLARKYNKDLPITVSFTVESNNTLLTGTDLETVSTILSRMDIFALGLNCAMGPDLMLEPLRKLSGFFKGRLYISPNAGLPESINGVTVYPMKVDKFITIIKGMLEELPICMVGGCCGTDASYISALSNLVKNYKLKDLSVDTTSGKSSSLFITDSLTQMPSPAFIGERANATGSKLFRDALLSLDVDKMIEVMRTQEKDGSHFIDLSLAYTGRDEVTDYKMLMPIVNQSVTAPLVIDTTSCDVMEASLKLYSGKPIINSTNLEDGGAKLHQVFKLVSAHPASMIALTIDEEGMAQTVEKKVEVAKRIYDIWCDEYGYPAEDLIIDPLTFSIGSGDESLRTAAIDTLLAITEIKKVCKGVKTVLGLSNVSFGLAPNSRPILNSVFLSRAVTAGLDMAIAHSSKLYPLSKLTDLDIEVCDDLIYYKKEDALERFISHFADTVMVKETYENLSFEDTLTRKILTGDKADLDILLLEILKEREAVSVINDLLLPAMQEVGKGFSEGKILLPFVLQSAEAMKRSVSILEPYLVKNDESKADTIILATVAGDVHDIGKNLVDIILTNNGYNVVNLGIKISVDEMIEAYKKHSATAIGMSGLLVKSTLIMRDNILKISETLGDTKVLLGGAALTRKFVEADCEPLIPEKVFYCKDAFDAINVLEDKYVAKKTPQREIQSTDDTPKVYEKEDITFSEVPTPPFYGVKIIEKYPLAKALKYFNKFSLFKTAWGYNIKDRALLAEAEAEYEMLLNKLIKDNVLDIKASYGFFKTVRKNETDGNMTVYDTDDNEIATFNFPFIRNRSLAEYFPVGKEDLIALQIVTVGSGAIDYSKGNFEESKYKDYLLSHGFFTLLTEAIADSVHTDIRIDLGFKDDLSVNSILSNKFRSCRYSFGYAQLPELSSNDTIIKLLGGKKLGISFNSSSQMEPEFTTAAIVIHHECAKY